MAGPHHPHHSHWLFPKASHHQKVTFTEWLTCHPAMSLPSTTGEYQIVGVSFGSVGSNPTVDDCITLSYPRQGMRAYSWLLFWPVSTIYLSVFV